MEHFHLIKDSLGISVTKPMKDSIEAEKLAVDYVASRQPLGRLPEWVLPSMTTSKHSPTDGIWVVQIDVFTRRRLTDGERWIQRGEHKTVAWTDPKTGEEMVELYGSSDQDRMTLFQVEVDIAKRKCTMLRETNLSSIDKSRFEIATPNSPDSPPSSLRG